MAAPTKIWLLESTYLDASGSPQILRASTAPDYMTLPTDSPPNTAYPSTVDIVGNFECHAWAKYTTRGQSTLGAGMAQLINAPPQDRSKLPDFALAPGRYDSLRGLGFDRQPLVIRRGMSNAAYPAGFPPYLTVTQDSAFFPWSSLQINFFDLLGYLYQSPLQQNLYGGTNALPAGFDGVATDLQGKQKPYLLGTQPNLSPVCVNTVILTYQITDRQSAANPTGLAVGAVTVSAVYDKGSALTAGNTYATIALLQAATTASGHYDFCDDPVYGAFIQLGSSPAGAITCDAAEGTAASATIAQIVKRIMTGPGGIQAALITGDTDLDSAAAGKVGFWFGTQMTLIGDAINGFLQTCNAYLVPNKDGTWSLGQLVNPNGLTPVATFREKDIKGGAQGINIIQQDDLGTDAPQSGSVISTSSGGSGYQVISSNAPSMSRPVYQVIMNYDFNPTVQSQADIAGAGLVRLGYTMNQWRQVTSDPDPTIQAKHAGAIVITLSGYYRTAADAKAEANRQLALRKNPPTVVEVPLDPDDAAPVNLMKAFSLNINRFDWGGGKNFLPIGRVGVYDNSSSASMETLIGWTIPS